MDPIIFKDIPTHTLTTLKPITNWSEKEVYDEKGIIFNSYYF